MFVVARIFGEGKDGKREYGKDALWMGFCVSYRGICTGISVSGNPKIDRFVIDGGWGHIHEAFWLLWETGMQMGMKKEKGNGDRNTKVGLSMNFGLWGVIGEG